jgi:NAD(P)-dependent dehydrogenase (short-subunit alcohol dehydrogenase family)
MKGQVAIVTGAAQGIGRGVAQRFLEAGAVVLLVDVEGEPLERTAAELTAGGGRCQAAEADVSQRHQVRAAVEACVEQFGRVDVLSANAGVAGVRPFMELEDAEWRRMLDVNLTGTFHCMQEAARPMVQAGRGAIVVTTSTNAFWVESGTAHYSASKGGLLTLVRTAALDLAQYGIRVNAVAPGIVKTRLSQFLTDDPVEGPAYLERVPLRRFAQPADIAEAVLFLASDAAAYITGEQLVVDGGVSIGVPIEATP